MGEIFIQTNKLTKLFITEEVETTAICNINLSSYTGSININLKK